MDNSLRSQLKATSIKRLQKQIDEDNAVIGAQAGTEYLNLEDGKTLKIRIFPAHPGLEDFYVARKAYWLSFRTEDGEVRRGTVLDSRVHGGTKWDVVEEYVKYAKKVVGNDADKLDALTGNGPKSNSLNPQYTWLCYADRIVGEDPLRAKVWEFKKMVRDSLNKLAFSEDEDEVIEVDPFTDPDEGLPILVTYRKNPNRKKGENYYEVSFLKQAKARPLTDDEIEYFMTLRPLTEVVSRYGMKDFERAMEGLQNFDEDNEIGLFDDDAWIAHLEEIKAQYDVDEADSSVKEEKKSVKKAVVKADDDEEEEEEDMPMSQDEFSDMDRTELKKYISKHGLMITVKKSMTDDDLREAIRVAMKSVIGEESVDDDEEEEEEEEVVVEKKPSPTKMTVAEIRAKLNGNKK